MASLRLEFERLGLRVLGLLAAMAPAAAAQAAAPASGPADLTWLSGCWERQTARGTTLEMWMPPAAGTMVGVSRSIRDGSVSAWEVLVLRVTPDGGILYIATPSGQSTTTFTGHLLADSGFVVENPAHDFPTRIQYRRVGVDSLLARIEGPGPNGTRGIDFAFRRAVCREADRE